MTMFDVDETKRTLTPSEKERAERNRLKAISLKKSRLLTHPYSGTGSKLHRLMAEIYTVFMHILIKLLFKKTLVDYYWENNYKKVLDVNCIVRSEQPKLVDSGGGFFIEELDAEAGKERVIVEAPGNERKSPALLYPPPIFRFLLVFISLVQF